jgi:hypothetical protein
MGRTLSTFTQLIDQEKEAWKDFRRALRKEDQEVFDRLFQGAKYHMASGVYASKAHPFEAIVMAILLEMRKSIIGLEQKVLALEELVEKKP